MSSHSLNALGPVKDADAKISEIVSKHEIKHAALVSLHQKHKESKVHHFNDSHMNDHIKNWKAIKYAEEVVAYGVNYFVKIHIGGDLCLHIRCHRQQHAEVYDFYSLHETIKHNEATFIWSLSEPLEYFNA